MGQVRNSVERTRLAMWSVETFSQLEQQEGVNPGWRQVGSLRVALTDERVVEFEHMKKVKPDDMKDVGLPRDDAQLPLLQKESTDAS
mgnify:CR=1 FL=1